MAEEPTLLVVRPRSVLRRKRFTWVLVPAVLVAVVGAITLSTNGGVTAPIPDVVVVEAKMASKEDFFNDAVVRRVLMENGIQVHLTATGSREVATGDLGGYDFVFPSGQPAALLIKQQRKAERRFVKPHKPFFSPVVLGTYRAYADALVEAGVATPQPGVEPPMYYNVNLAGFLGLTRAGKTWQGLGGDAPLGNGNRVLAQTSDVCYSNSAGTYMGMAAFAVNDRRPPADEAEAVALAEEIRPLLTAQGFPGDDMAQAYLAPEGRGLAPVSVFYEHQFLAHQVRTKDLHGGPDSDRVLLYPEDQVQAVPELIALTPNGERVGELVTNDPRLRRRALELGFRVFETDDVSTSGEFGAFLREKRLPMPVSGIGDTETFLPPLDLLEKMIKTVGRC
ncbi:hypothetical protein UO65_5638 [Actinokineospora spheciospongiae]|uniref:Extracellular solute-binding protein n=1 Tax=Actinokineospora spheciospongiae TaxID=909613 RepID=W7IRI3_9PSEU|nr:hypothetical protein [Actinokineospora spheciospongiae]EWC59086.1 hypothetical protein UO65_5638 [Actinokineospora spheciospongiae]